MYLHAYTAPPALVSGARLLADWTGRAIGTSFDFGEHGPRELSTFIPMSYAESITWVRGRAFTYIEFGVGGCPIWSGRLEEPTLVDGGLEIRALGGFVALTDTLYSASWSETTLERWREVTSDDQALRAPEMYEIDFTNRIFIALKKNETYANGTDMGSVMLKIPSGSSRQYVAASFTFEQVLPTNWRARLIAFSADFSSSAVLWTSTGTGAAVSGSQNLTFTATDVLCFTVDNNSGASTTPTQNTGDRYLKVTGLRVKTTTTATVYADEIARALLTAVRSVNSNWLRSSTSRITSPSVDLQQAIYEDMRPADIFAELASGNGSARWEYGVDENLYLYFRQRGANARTWYVDATSLTVSPNTDGMINSAYAVYQDTKGERQVTSTSTSAASISRFGLTRQGVTKTRSTTSTEADAARNTQLAVSAEPPPRVKFRFAEVYDSKGARYPLWAIRPGDMLRLRNLDVAFIQSLGDAAAIRVAGVRYDVDSDRVEVEPEAPLPDMAVMLAEG